METDKRDVNFFNNFFLEFFESCVDDFNIEF